MYKRLTRSESERIVAGVLGGIAEYFKIDPTLVRLLFVAGLVFSAFTLSLVYILAIFIVPNEREVH